MTSSLFVLADASTRYDLYGPIHKGLRLGHCRLLAEISACDFASVTATADLVGSVSRHLDLCRHHLAHEDHEIHAALEARRPGASLPAEQGHDGHIRAFVDLDGLVGALATASAAERPRIGRALYDRFTHFVADDFAHMAEEETLLRAALEAAFTDDELRAIEGRIVATIPPAEMAAYLALMVAAATPDERVAMLRDMRAGMPAEAFEGVMVAVVLPNVPANQRAALQAQV